MNKNEKVRDQTTDENRTLTTCFSDDDCSCAAFTFVPFFFGFLLIFDVVESNPNDIELTVKNVVSLFELLCLVVFMCTGVLFVTLINIVIFKNTPKNIQFGSTDKSNGREITIV